MQARNLLLFLPALIFLSIACSTKSQTIRFLEATNLQVPHLPGPGKIEGQHCTHRLLFISLQSPRIDKAITNALNKRNNKYNALADAEMSYSKKPIIFSNGFFGSEDCVTIIGRPILLVKPAAPEGLYKTSESPYDHTSADWSF